jgi:hypothetical protein
MKAKRNLLVALILLAQWLVATVALASEPLEPEPESQAQKICDTPTNLTGPVTLPTWNHAILGASNTWDGAAYAVAWSTPSGSHYHVYFACVAADGTLLRGPIQVDSSSLNAEYPSIVSNGAGYAVAWQDTRTSADRTIYFALLDAGGNNISGDIPVSGESTAQVHPSLVWNGSGYGVAWVDNRVEFTNIFFARLSATGVKNGNDSQVSPNSAGQFLPSLVWNGAGYGLVWVDERVLPTNIYFARLDTNGAPIAGSVEPVCSSTAAQSYPSLVWNGMVYGVAWAGAPSGNGDIYFARLAADGTMIWIAISVNSISSGDQYSPSLAWTGSEWGVAWRDGYTMPNSVSFARLSAEGAPVGSQVFIDTPVMGVGIDDWPFDRSLAFGTKGYGVVWSLGSQWVNFAGLGCHADTTPPSCPVSPAEVLRTTSPTQTVTLAWGPSQDYESEIARYVITRNGVDVGTTADRTWTDPNFDPTKGYVYWIDAVNSAEYYSTGCTGSVDTSDHVPPTCPGNLMATYVTSSQVNLIWLASSDDKSGVRYYLVYRNNALLWTLDYPTRWYNDTSITPNTTHNYAVTAVDWAGNERTACQSLWVSTSPITLMMTKNADGINANLDWTDVNINPYVLYRSPDPQAFSELKRVPVNSTTDPVMQDGVKLWFYYVQQKE